MFRLIFGYLILAFFMGFYPFGNNGLSNFNSSSSYDKGYSDGYDGLTPTSYKSNYYDGWLDGDFDAECDYLKYNKKDYEEFKNFGCGNWNSW